MDPIRGIDRARRATVRVCRRDGLHRGQGLLLKLSEGQVVLTCHHIIASIEKEDLCIAIPRADGQLTDPIPASYYEQHSRPAMDAVVLRVDLGSYEIPEAQPLLHALNPQ